LDKGKTVELDETPELRVKQKIRIKEPCIYLSTKSKTRNNENKKKNKSKSDTEEATISV
jgi:hypothetical protein